jgi:hypothetical protein
MEIDGRLLRRVLVTWLMDAGPDCPLTVPELAQRLEQARLEVRGRGGKAVSDALRWEIRRGRVLRIGRGLYVLGGPIPRSTAWKIRRQASEVLHPLPACAPRAEEATLDAVTAAALEHLTSTRRTSSPPPARVSRDSDKRQACA